MAAAVTAKKAAPKRAAAKKPVVTKLTSEFEYTRETTGTLRLDEDAEKEDRIMGALYLQKLPLDGAQPKRVRVTIDILEFQEG